MTKQPDTKLIDKTGYISDTWHRIEDGEETSVAAHQLVRIDKLHGYVTETDLPNAQVGVYLDNDTSFHEIEALPKDLGLIAIDFPSFADGRGFSLAQWVRDAGFAGRLRASGPLIADQFAFTLACGFDEVEIPLDLAARQPESQWKSAAGEISHAYQPEAKGSILKQRHSG